MLGLANTVSSSSTLESLYSITLDGANDHINLGDVLDLGTADFSISFWAYVPEGTSQNFISKFEDSDNRWFITTQGSDKLQFLSNVSGSTTMSNSYSGDAVPENEWFHGVITCDRSDTSAGLTVYVNAVAGTANAADATTLSNSGNLHFGRQNSSYIGANSKMTDVAIWNVALNLANVQAIYNSGKPTDLTFDSGNYDNSSALQGYWRMGNGSFDDKANGVIHDQHAPGFGAEILTNGDFSTAGEPTQLTHSLGWYASDVIGQDGSSIAGGELIMANDTSNAHYGRVYATDGSSTINILTAGKVYKFVYTVSEVSGSPVLKYFNGSSYVTTSSTVGEHTVYYTLESGQVFILSNTYTGAQSQIKLSNVSLKQLNGFPGLTSNVDVPTAFTSDTP